MCGGWRMRLYGHVWGGDTLRWDRRPIRAHTTNDKTRNVLRRTMMIHTMPLTPLTYRPKSEESTVEGIPINTEERHVLEYFSDMNRKIFPMWCENSQKREPIERSTQDHLIKNGLLEYTGTHNGWDYYQITAKGIASL